MIFRRTLFAAAAALVTTALMTAGAADTADPVVATVNGADILRSQVIETRQRLPRQFQEMPLETVFPMLVNSIIDSKLAAAAARRDGLDADPEVKRRIGLIVDQVLERIYMRRAIDAEITDEALQALYAEKSKESVDRVQVRASHILVATEAAARQIIGDLAGGADFAALAKERSTGPSGNQGGDLGYFAAGDMVPAFSRAAFALEKGAITKDPVQTQYGWHVIKSVDRRVAAMQPFAHAEAGLREELSRQIGSRILKRLRDAADITRTGPDGAGKTQ